MEYSIKPKSLGERRIIHYPQKRIIGLYVIPMAMYDWNHNGKNDRQDDYLEYMIYKDCTNDNNSNTNHSSYNSDSAFGMNVFVVIAVIAIFAFIGNAMEESTPKCIKPGCNNEQTQNSSYCYLHKPYSGGYTSSGSSSSGNSSSSSSSSYSDKSYPSSYES